MWLCTMLWKTLHYTNWYLKSTSQDQLLCIARIAYYNNKNSNNIKMYKKRTIEEMQQGVPPFYFILKLLGSQLGRKIFAPLKSGFARSLRFQVAKTSWGLEWLETNINAQGRTYRPHVANAVLALTHFMCIMINISSPWVCEIP